ncbi:MAG: protein kinase domain-containing protein [Acidobacteriota bacterium]
MIGSRIGRYEIVARIGAGGMGEVYRARDASLERDLAIKILPADLTRDSTRVERFMQEARAASALNHPHLTAIYEIGTEPVHYIAMELVRGRNLRDALSAGPLDLKRTIDCLLPVCDALGAAHLAGVVHRDIKPENVMLADDGYVKVLDFGVAKLKPPAAAAGDDATRASLTDVGTMVGTSGYMSPEQARGLATDHRTDIFAVGCVLYECLTGSRAFDAPSAIERIHRVINDEPAPIAARVPGVPSDLVRVVRKCLAKDPDERYQTMKDVVIDLRDIRRQIEAGAAGLSPPPARATPARGLLAGLAAAAAVAVGALVWYTRPPASPADEPAALPRITVERMTTSGNTIDSAISPDGRYLAHVEANGQEQSLWIKQIETGQERQIVAPASFGYFGVRFTPDGREVYYTSRGEGHGSGRLNAVARDGGPSRALLDGILTAATFSPDGRRIAFYRELYPDQESSALMVAAADGRNDRMLASRRMPEAFSPGFFTGPSWSPDGRVIVASVRDRRASVAKLIAFEADSTATRELLTSPEDITFTLWLPDGSGIVYVARGFVSTGSLNGQLWLKPFPEGTPRRITSDVVDYRQASITADGRTLTAVGQEFHGALYAVPLDGSPPQRILSERYDGYQGITQLRDESFIVGSLVNGNSQVVRIAAGGSTRTVLTTVGANSYPTVSPDESHVAMVSLRDGKVGIWLMRIDGSQQRLLANLAAPNWLSFTPDGGHVICTSYGSAVPSTWRIPVDGGQAVEIARQFDRAVISPDGKWLGGIYASSVNTATTASMAAIIPLDGSAPLRVLGPLIAATGTGLVTWARDGSGLIASTRERFNLHFYPLTGAGPRQLTALQDETFIRGTLAPDGRHVIASRGRLLRDTFTIRGFK